VGVAIALVVLGIGFIAAGWRLSTTSWKRSDPVGFELGIAPPPGQTSGVPGWMSFMVLIGLGMLLLGLFGILGLWLRWF
jgi:uncharacterized membrane protein YphA (DoxX/SURF4 family)